MRRMIFKLAIFSLLILTLVLMSTAQAPTAAHASTPYWLYNTDVKVGQPIKIAVIPDPNGGRYEANTYVYRIMDWQTGKVIYVASTGYTDTSPTVTVADIQHAQGYYKQ